MGIKSIKIKNLLSFDELFIENIADINCIIGRNNVGKSNLLKLIRFFYQKLEGKRELPPTLNSNYSSFGSITIEYDFSRLSKIIVSSFKAEGRNFFKQLATKFFPNLKNNGYSVKLIIHSNDVVEWAHKDKDISYLINFLFPFFEIEARHIDLYDWNQLWHLVSRLKSFNVSKIDYENIIQFFDDNISEGSRAYTDYVEKIRLITKTNKYTYRQKVLNYIKVGLEGQEFHIDGHDLNTQSDGTNSHRYIEIFLELLISLTRTSYISPIVYIDEPEIGLHPKKNEELIANLYEVYLSFKKIKQKKEEGKYKTPYPNIFMATHSPNIVKVIIKLFKENQQVLHFSKEKITKVTKLNSVYSDTRFLNRFSDNEARLFFSERILFVEGESELEFFLNMKLLKEFPHLKKLDVYRSVDASILNHINPSYANAAIPYLILRDADKFLIYDQAINKFKLINLDKQLSEFREKIKFARFEVKSKDFKLKKNITTLDSNLEKIVKLDKNKLYVKNNAYSELILSLNTVLKNIHLRSVNTTIEGVLINRASFKLFKKWISYEIKNNLYIHVGKNETQESISHKIASLKGQLESGRKSIQQVSGALLSCEKNDIYLVKDDQYFIDQLKEDYIAEVWKLLARDFKLIEERVIVMRLIFDGKTELLYSRSHDAYEPYYSDSFREKVKRIKVENLKAVSFLFGKTSGWMTKFIEFSIDWINTNKRSEDFDKMFELYFPELYNIIKVLQFR